MTEQWRIDREKYKAFSETDLGKAFNKYENATIRYWQNDSSETISDKRLTELDNTMRNARREFLDLIMGNTP